MQNNGIRNLANCYKLYFHNAKYRIIYIKENENILIHNISSENLENKNIAKIVGIGKRANYEIYDIVAKRLKKFVDKHKND